MSDYQVNNVGDFVVIGSHSPDEVLIQANDSRDQAPLWLSMPKHVALVLAAQISAKVIEMQNENNREKA